MARALRGVRGKRLDFEALTHPVHVACSVSRVITWRPLPQSTTSNMCVQMHRTPSTDPSAELTDINTRWDASITPQSPKSPVARG